MLLGRVADAFGVLRGEAALLLQLLGVERGHRGMLTNLLVHEGLGVARLVALVVAVAAEAHQIHHHVALKLLAVLGGQPHDVHAGLRVVAVDVEDGDVEHLGHRRAVDAAPTVLGEGGVAELVVDHEVHRAPGVVAA